MGAGERFSPGGWGLLSRPEERKSFSFTRKSRVRPCHGRLPSGGPHPHCFEVNPLIYKALRLSAGSQPFGYKGVTELFVITMSFQFPEKRKHSVPCRESSPFGSKEITGWWGGISGVGCGIHRILDDGEVARAVLLDPQSIGPGEIHPAGHAKTISHRLEDPPRQISRSSSPGMRRLSWKRAHRLATPRGRRNRTRPTTRRTTMERYRGRNCSLRISSGTG